MTDFRKTVETDVDPRLVVVQRLGKLCRPMREWQCLLHTAQMNLWSREK